MKQICFVLRLWACFVAVASCTSVRADPVELVVQVNASQEVGLPPSAIGSGVIVANDGRTAIIITAFHTIRDSAESDETFLPGPIDRVNVVFYRDGGQRRPAILLLVDEAADLALLSVEADEASRRRFEENRDILMPTGIPISTNHDSVEIIGTKESEPWSSSERPAPILSVSSMSIIEFDSDIASGGFSGGPLLTSTGNLIGMVLKAGLQDEALSITYIRGVIERAQLPFDLRENGDSISRIAASILAKEDIVTFASDAMSADILDFGELHLLWIARPEFTQLRLAMASPSRTDRNRPAIETMIRQVQSNGSCYVPSFAPGDDIGYTQQVLSYALKEATEPQFTGSCREHMQLWFRRLGEVFDPNLVIQTTPNDASDGVRSLLSAAIAFRNPDAAIGLLEGGAVPNPFVNPDGYHPSNTMFLYPVEALERNFTGIDADMVLAAMRRAGLFVISEHFGDFETNGSGSFTIERKSEISRDRDPEFCVRINHASRIDWCEWARSLDVTISFDPNPAQGLVSAVPEVLLFADTDHAYFFSPVLVAFGRTEPAILRISRDLGDIAAFLHAGRYGCHNLNPRDIATYCWRSYPAHVFSFRTAPERASVQPWPVQASQSGLADFRVGGVSLANTVEEAARILAARGFTNDWVSQIGSYEYRDRSLKFDFRKQDSSCTCSREITLFTINDAIMAIRFNRVEIDIEELPSPWLDENSNLTGVLHRRTDFDSSASSGKLRSPLLIVEETPTGFASAWTSIGSQSSGLLTQRRTRGNPAERALVGWLIDEYLGKIEQGYAGRCVDEYWRFRTPRGSRCRTSAETATAFMEQNLRRQSVRRLTDWMQAQVIEEGDGKLLRPGAAVTVNTVWRRVDLLDPASRKGSSSRSNRQRFYVGHAYNSLPLNVAIGEALSSMSLGSRWQLFIRPEEQEDWSGSEIAALEIEVLGYDEAAVPLDRFLRSEAEPNPLPPENNRRLQRRSVSD